MSSNNNSRSNHHSVDDKPRMVPEKLLQEKEDEANGYKVALLGVLWFGLLVAAYTYESWILGLIVMFSPLLLFKNYT